MRKLPLFFLLILTGSTMAGVIVLKDGTRLEGDVKRTEQGWTITTSDGKSQTVAPSTVDSIELGGGNKSGTQEAESLASLRRSVDALNDIGQIIDRYQHFIAGVKDQKVLADAQADLTTWQQRKDQGVVKHGSKWISPDEISGLSAKADAIALDAREMIRQNRLREAEQMLAEALNNDPLNPAALYLRGVELYRQDKFADARKSFETLNANTIGHAPTLNNLAVILWRQNAQNGSLNYFDQAMQASPVNKFILDNVAEALGAIPEDQRKGNTMLARVLRRFTEQDTVLQQQMQKQGLYRWGSGWVNQKQLDDLKAAEKDVRDKLDAMQTDFEQTKVQIAQLGTQIQEDKNEMNLISSRNFSTDSKGNMVLLPMPPAYYDLQTKIQDLQSQQAQLQAKLNTMQDQAKRIQQQVPIPQFTGVQQIVGVEGMPPVADQASPSSQPAATAPLPQSLGLPMMNLHPSTQEDAAAH